MAPELTITDVFPEFLVIGLTGLQEPVLTWLRSPVAKECGVQSVSVGLSTGFNRPDSLFLSYVIKVDHDRNLPPEDQRYRFPVEDLLRHIIDQTIQPEHRDEMKSRIPQLRGRDPKAYEKFKTAEPRRLYVACKNPECPAILETQMTLYPGETIKLHKFDPIDCPKCGHTSNVVTTDFFTPEDWTPAVDFPEIRQMFESDPSVKGFAIRIKGADALKHMGLMGSLNDREFRGRAPETVMFIGPRKGARGHFADLIFAERPVSFNKMQHPETGHWEYVVHAQTGARPYALADFSPMLESRLEVR